MPDTSAPLREIAEDYKGKNADEMLSDLNSIPFFMNDFKEGDEENPQIGALRALAYEGEPWEIAENFKQQGNQCFKERKYKDAAQFYTQALDQLTERKDIRVACLRSRAQCNLELKNYRKCITDCTQVLDLDPENVKAWFRSAEAFLLLDKPDEAIVCCEHGLSFDANNENLKSVMQLAQARKARLLELRKQTEQCQQRKADVQRTLQLALDSRKFRFKKTAGNSELIHPVLEDELDPQSTLYLPVLVLYPLAMESDILQQVDEQATVGDILDQVFGEMPSWANPTDYAPTELEVYAPTSSGGLVKVGRKLTLRKVLGTPNVVLVDRMARLYFVPKSKAAGWLSEWNKDAQAQLFR